MKAQQFPWEYQMDAKDCDPACLKIVVKWEILLIAIFEGSMRDYQRRRFIS